jgi:4-hydroxy-tetrahydrodipicolinate synthase
MGDALWTGPAVALVTLFDDEGLVAVDETGAHAARLVAAGLRAVLVAGSTGEAGTLTDAERTALVTAVRAACPGVPVIAGASGEWRGQAAARTAAVLAAGADAVLVAPPLRGGSIEDYFAQVADAAAGKPVFAYHYPGVAGGDVPVDMLAKLPVAGIKDSTGLAGRLAEEIDLDWPGAVYTGSAALLGYARWAGAAGAIVAAGNVVPKECLAAWEGDATAQREVLRVERSYRATFPAGIKAAVAERFDTPVGCRLG